MEGSLDDLIRFLLEEIALCGEQGPFRFWFCSSLKSAIVSSMRSKFMMPKSEIMY